jgi:hypothetical protein
VTSRDKPSAIKYHQDRSWPVLRFASFAVEPAECSFGDMTLGPGFDTIFLGLVPVLALIYLLLYVARRVTRTQHQRQQEAKRRKSAP